MFDIYISEVLYEKLKSKVKPILCPEQNVQIFISMFVDRLNRKCIDHIKGQ